MKKQLQCFVFWGGYSRVLWFLYSLLLLREYGNWLHLSNYTNKKLRSVAYVQAFSWVIFSNRGRGGEENKKKEKQAVRWNFSSSISGAAISTASLPFFVSFSVTFQQLLFSVGWFFSFLFRHDKGVHSHIPCTASAKQRVTVRKENQFPLSPPQNKHTHAHTDKCIYTAARKNAVNIQNVLWSSFKSQFHTNRVTKVKTQNQWYDSCLQWTHWVTVKVEKVLNVVTLV